MKEYIQEKSHMSVKPARKDSIKIVVWKDMKEFTQNKRHIKCISNMTDVTKGSEIKKKNSLQNEHDWRLQSESAREKALTLNEGMKVEE